MCGRYAAFREAQDLADTFDIEPDDIAEDAALLPPSWNVAPTDAVRVVVERAPRAADGEDEVPDDVVRSLRLARWGLVPGWAKDPSVGSRMINARVESLVDKPAFRKAAAARRCLVPAEGYFEWRKPPAGSPAKTPKQPFWIHADDGSPLAFAGLYEFWRDRSLPDDDPHRWLVTMTIITGGAPTDDPVLAEIHDRRPVVLGRERWAAWLDPHRTDAAEAVDLLQDPAPRLVATPVSTAVNSVRTNGPELVERLPDADDETQPG
ncbi:SOS response-associated peptidase [Actinotalea ferrariae]|uniref:SOS response-associated peptidase n=1 Tax=Actinotalea ferrariae TaxID=1386098 RepID=UPI001C8BFBB2|nr:SOS response-associated peptidase [Actinotalea ferrariae]MBX9245957.1 SOS response-associated peptidase [Actinotalea ferrariae]